MSSIIAIALKDLRALWRDRMALFWVLAFAPICATFFGTIFSGGGGGEPNRMKVAVIDGDHSDASQSFMDRLAASDALDRKSQRLNSSHLALSRMPSSA